MGCLIPMKAYAGFGGVRRMAVVAAIKVGGLMNLDRDLSSACPHIQFSGRK